MKLSWEYIAGFFDGEGCISLQTNVSHKQRDYHRVRLILAQSRHQDAVLFEIAEFLEGEGFHPTVKPAGRSMTHLFLYRQGEIEDILCALMPFLRVKKEKAKDALKFIEDHRTRSRTKERTKVG